MRLVSVKDFDVINSLNISVSVWCGYCPIRCEGCHNSSYWGIDSGVEFNDKHIDTILSKLSEYVDKDLSILGGEPLSDINVDGVYKLVKSTKAKYPNKTIMMWTGYEWDKIKHLECLRYVDILVDGRYIAGLKNNDCRFIGSSNQRIIDVKKSISKGEVVLFDTTNLQEN